MMDKELDEILGLTTGKPRWCDYEYEEWEERCLKPYLRLKQSDMYKNTSLEEFCEKCYRNKKLAKGKV